MTGSVSLFHQILVPLNLVIFTQLTSLQAPTCRSSYQTHCYCKWTGLMWLILPELPRILTSLFSSLKFTVLILTVERHVWKLGGKAGVSAVRERADGQRHCGGLAHLGTEPLRGGCSEHQSSGTGDRSLHRLDRGQWDLQDSLLSYKMKTAFHCVFIKGYWFIVVSAF